MAITRVTPDAINTPPAPTKTMVVPTNNPPSAAETFERSGSPVRGDKFGRGAGHRRQDRLHRRAHQR